MSRFTFSSAEEDDPLWSPDGRTIVVALEGDLAQKAANGLGDVEYLLKTKSDKVPNDWSPDGKYILYSDFVQNTLRDIWVLPREGDKKPFPFAQTEFMELNAQFSEDGHWIAYSSNETGTHEVYVQGFPVSGGKWQISVKGGVQPRWTRQGKEIVYVDLNGKFMSVEVAAAGSSFHAGVPTPLFTSDLAGITSARHLYDVSEDGMRFVLIREQASERSAEPVNLITNWAEELRRK